MPADLLPKKGASGAWQKPRVSSRRAARIRKEALLDGTFGSWDAETGKGWDPAWDKPRLSTVPPPPKGHKHDHRLGERLEKIQRALANQEQRVADFQKTRPAKRIRTGFRLVMKKNPWEE
ncbi:hypothetical protein FNF27_01939 [Cafeteria roenbergensis]|uniref:Large ribosomal subunit protein mL59 domain-containing protein n=2 Tax=Cafeteria roenbergensis TaxID=33653 RepID=A0A5A8DUN1_CAFRO|nr:hypothetical protein FNF31_00080 [Cafeteria roenbergensis]KAA0170556.1 hypothetical protein FNF28_01318 [Cafeteria roenbergensis]KAA0176658.1 hypothetical protein FNF27_01939 [Cafeteria roenbergensis]